MRTLVGSISFALLLSALAGCGQLGPLYMPAEEPLPATEPATKPVTEPAAAADTEDSTEPSTTAEQPASDS